MKKLLFILTLALGSFVTARTQPNITTLPYVQFGMVKERFCDTTGIQIPAGGENQTWNYGTFSILNDVVHEVAGLDGVPDKENYPEAAFVFKDAGYVFFKKNDSELIRLGSSNAGKLEILTDPEISFSVPFTMNTVHTDDFSGTLKDNNLTFNETGTITQTGIGYGTITIPTGVFQNVLLMKQDRNSNLVYNYQGANATYNYSTTSYIFIDPESNQNLLQISKIHNVLTVTGQIPVVTDSTVVSYFNIFPGYKPDIPELISPSDAEANIPQPVKFNWRAVSGFTVLYKVEVSKSEDFSNPAVSTVTADTFALAAGLDFSAKYYWHVQTVDGNSKSDWSATRSFTTAQPSVGKPVLINPENHSNDVPVKPDFSWTAVDGAESYTINISQTDNFSDNLEIVNGLTGNSYTPDSELYYNTTYYWRVQASQNSQPGEWSDTWSFNTAKADVTTPVPSSPADKSTGLNPAKVNLIWDNQGTGVEYNLQVATDENFENLEYDIQSLKDNQKEINDLTPETTYYWHLAASNGLFTSPWSAVWSFTTGTLGVSDWDLNPSHMNITLVPMPAQSLISMTFSAPADGKVNCKIIDLNGNTLLSKESSFIKQGLANIQFNIDNIPAGSYFISIEGSNYKAVTKFIKK